MREERKNATPAQTSAAGTYTPLKLTSCMISVCSRKKARVPQQCIGDQGGLDCNRHPAPAFDWRPLVLLCRKPSEALLSRGHIPLGKLGERLIECVTGRQD